MRLNFKTFCQRQQRMRRVTDYIGTHLDEDLCLADLAEIACVSPAHLVRLYRPRVGESPIQTLLRLRLERAREQLLQNRFDSVTDLALAAGYGSVAAFTHAFCRRFGVAPTRLPPASLPLRQPPHLSLETLPERKVWQFSYSGCYRDNGYYKARLAWLCLEAGARRWRGWRMNDRDAPFGEAPDQHVELGHFVSAADYPADIREADCVTHPAAHYAMLIVHPDARRSASIGLSQRIREELGCELVDGRSLERDLHIRDFRAPQDRRIALYLPVRPLRR